MRIASRGTMAHYVDSFGVNIAYAPPSTESPHHSVEEGVHRFGMVSVNCRHCCGGLAAVAILRVFG